MSEEIKLRLALAFQLAFMALSLTILTAVPLGVVAAYCKGRWQDYIIQVLSITGVAIPSFWLGIMVLVGILIIAQKLTGSAWMPPIIFVSPFKQLIKTYNTSNCNCFEIYRHYTKNDAICDIRNT